MALTPSEITLIETLKKRLDARRPADLKRRAYYNLQQRIQQMGLAVPPNLRQFSMAANWPRVVVRTISSRQKVRALILPGQETFDPKLRAIWDANNLDSHTAMFRRDVLVYGRAFMSVGANEKNPALPFVRVESPLEIEAMVDIRTEAMVAAARFYGEDPQTGQAPTNVTLYLPNETIWVEWNATQRKWVEVDRDVHNLGVVPIIMHLNDRESGSFEGRSELDDIIPLTDAVARSLTNLQFAQEAHGIPRKYMTGIDKGDFIGADGKPITQFEAYFDAIHMLSKEGAKVGQLTAADLKNFTEAMNIYGQQAAITTGFPARYFGITTANPAAEGAIRADEIELTNTVELKNAAEGTVLGWVGALALRFATGTWVEGNRVRVDYFDPATPTVAQRADALAKLRASGDISREGVWDELQWSEARKAKERQYLQAEAEASIDPYLKRQMEKELADANAAADGA